MNIGQRGQTLVMALVILGILLVLGLVFLGIISKNIRGMTASRQRTIATDLAEAGVRYAHFQLRHSSEGADWHPVLTNLAPVGTDTTVDPDVLYLRPGTGLGLRDPADPQLDLGGPDGLGPFTRINFQGGRSITRVRFGPSDANIFSTDPQGSIRTPGKARMYLIIESIGREGQINLNDPTTLPTSNAVRFRNYANWNQFQGEFGRMKDNDKRFVTSKKVTAFVSIGIIESGRFITNKYNVTREADLGVPDLGVDYEGVPVTVPLLFGEPRTVYDLGNPPTPSATPISTGGSIVTNAALRIHGNLIAHLNYTLADVIGVYGSVLGADANAMLTINRASWNRTTSAWQQTTANLTNAAGLDSRDPLWSTVQGVLRDGFSGVDPAGFPRFWSRKYPPSMLVVDPETGQNRYLICTQQSGPLVNNGNSGRFGHGQGPYINNSADRQIRSDEAGREEVGPAESLYHDWLNPNNDSGNWKGPFYVPRGAYMQLLTDGFSITRDPHGPNNERFWRTPDGTNTNNTTIRYRLGLHDFDGDGVQEWSIINTFTPGVQINAANPNFALGQAFNGVVYFEGNVRIRGIIPTDVQMTIVSNANIYIEGSITKGIIGSAGILNRPSRSMLMLMAKDFVVLNTTQFFGPGLQDVEEPNEQASSVAWNPIKITEPGGSVSLRMEQLLNPAAGNPNTWSPYANTYRQFQAPGSAGGADMIQTFMVSHTQEDGAAPYSFMSMDVNYGLPQSNYLFAMSTNNSATGFYPPGYITPGYTAPNYVPIYGLGVEMWQRYPKFESIGFPMVDPANASYTGGMIQMAGPEGNYSFLTQETSDIRIRTNNIGAATNSYYLARAALVPHDIRIEASMFAEEGSFFVIPGQWYNPNPNDTRERYATLAPTEPERRQIRKEMYGSFPEMPFYAEPLDVRVQIFGAVSENMPPPISQQAEWLKKWGWIPRRIGATGSFIPQGHVPTGFDIRDSGTDRFVPNLIYVYDQSLATARVGGFDTGPANPLIRTDKYGRALPPMPRLPVSPTLAFFGEVNP